MKNQVTRRKKLLRVGEVADGLNCSTRTVYRLIADGELSALRIRSSLRVYSESVDDYLRREKMKFQCEMNETGVWDSLADFARDD